MKIDTIKPLYYKRYNISFKSLQKRNADNPELMYNTGFFRDIDTLDYVSNKLNSEFPEGGTVIVGACSNGEEIIGLKSLLGNSKFDIIGFDSFEDAINLAQRNVYKINQKSLDAFLLQDDRYLNDVQLRCKKHFFELMEATDGNSYRIKNGSLPIKQLDVRDINKISNKNDICSVLFRNAFYFLTKNYSDKSKSKGFETDINRYNIFDEIVVKIDDILKPKGLFVIGNIPREHLILIDDNTPQENRYILNSSNNECCIESPLNICLTKHNFKPVFYSKMFTSNGVFNSKKLVPTVWMKL